MKLYFTTDGFYNNPNIPLYDHDKVYEITDVVPGYIQRWLIRGAIEVVKGSAHDKLVVSQPNPQDGHEKKRATPVGGPGNPIEVTPHAPANTSPAKTSAGEEDPKKAADKSAKNK